MIANTNLPQLDPDRLDQMIALALSHPQEQKSVSSIARGSWRMTDWFKRPALVPIPVRAFAVMALLAIGGFQMMPTATTSANQTADTDVFADVSDYMTLDLLDQLI